MIVKQIVVTRIENGYIVQRAMASGMSELPPATYCANLDAVFALMEQMFEAMSREERGFRS